VILVTLVGQGLTLPLVIRWVRWDGIEDGDDELERGRAAIYEAGLAAIRIQRPRWPDHQPLLDRMEEGIRDRQQHLPTEDADETEERRIEQLEHREIRLAVVGKQRRAVNALRDEGVINDATLRTIERELDLDELQTDA
jgi:CPA1 family monovalent cation:H+ antiporter